jgi:hypothetical protein
MASRFLATMTADIGAVKRAVGAEGGTPRTSGNNATDIVYIPISQQDMIEFRDFYKKMETDIANANGIKDFYTLNDNVSYFFGTEELDDEKYAIRKPLNALQSEARAWYDMYGFVAVYNPDARADQRLREINAEMQEQLVQGSVGAPYTGQFMSALEMPDMLLAEATRLVKNAMQPNSQETLKRIVGDDFETLGGPLKRARGATEPIGTIIQNPRISSVRNPGAVLRLNPAPRSSEASISPSANTSLVQYDEQRAREQRSNTRRTLDETLIDLRNLVIPNPEDGRFYLEYDRASMTKRVVFARLSTTTEIGKNAADGANQISNVGDTIANGQSLLIDPHVFVYVWDNRMPFNDGTMNSKMYEVIKRRKQLDIAERNAADVDLTNSHPVQLLEHVPVLNKLDVERMTDSQLYGGGATQTATETREEMRRDAVLNVQLQAAAALQNGRRLNELWQLVASGKVGKTSTDANGNPSYAEFKKLGYLPLPSGFKIATATRPEITSDIEMLVYRYRRALSNALGVPMVLLDGGSSFSGRASKNSSGSSSASTSTASQAIGDSRLRNTVIADRAIVLKPFIENFWDIMYREIDNQTLQTLLDKTARSAREESEFHLAEMRLIKKRLETITDLAEQTRVRSDLTTRWNEIQAAVARLRDLSSRVRHIVSMQHRFRVEYKSLSFVPPPELQAAQMAGAISQLDYANALRANFGMSPMSKADFDKVKNEALDERVGQMEAEAKVQQKFAIPSGTGGGKKPKITKPAGGAGASK